MVSWYCIQGEWYVPWMSGIIPLVCWYCLQIEWYHPMVFWYNILVNGMYHDEWYIPQYPVTVTGISFEYLIFIGNFSGDHIISLVLHHGPAESGL
jgi:hypothetical protein